MSFFNVLTDKIFAYLSCVSTSKTEFVLETEPRSIGKISVGRQIVDGKINLVGQIIHHNDEIWNLKTDKKGFFKKIHSFDWVDDLAALGSLEARRFAQNWLSLWMAKYSSGSGPGWAAELTGMRLVRWAHHYLFLTQGLSEENLEKFNILLARQAKFLSKRAIKASAGLPRFEALLGLIYAGCYLKNMERFIEPATVALAHECRHLNNTDEIVLSRNPQEILNIFTILIWAKLALKDSNWNPSATHLDTIEKLAPILRHLRHSDAGLPRFHGSCGDVDGQLDQALSHAANREIFRNELSVGFARLSNSRTTIIIDAAPPPIGKPSFIADASTLAFEMVSGQRRIFTSCGPGYLFGSDFSSVSRQTSSHCAVYLEGHNSSHFSEKKASFQASKNFITTAPVKVPHEISAYEGKEIFEGAHDGYVKSHGLTHVRKLKLAQSGQTFEGEDLLIAIDDVHKHQFDKSLKSKSSGQFLAKAAFHFHPNVAVRWDQDKNLISLALKNGEIWIFDYGQDLKVTFEPTVFFEAGLFEPVESQKLILSADILKYGTRIEWSITRTFDKDLSVGDLFEN